jgi:hypothetical protein
VRCTGHHLLYDTEGPESRSLESYPGVGVSSPHLATTERQDMTKSDLLDLIEASKSNRADWYIDEEEENPSWICVDYTFPGAEMYTQVTLEKFPDEFVVINPQQGYKDHPQENYVKLSLECQDELKALFQSAFDYVTG